MTQVFFVPGPLPGANAALGQRHRGAYYRAKEVCQRVIALAIMQAKLKPMKTVYIEYLWIEKDRRRDHSNCAFAQKYIEDALVQCGILLDDGWDEVTGFSHDFVVDKARPGVSVKLIEST